MCNWRTWLLDGGQPSRCNRTGDRSDHGGMNHLSGDQIIRLFFSESQEFADQLSLTAFATARHPALAHPPLQARRHLRLKPEGKLFPSRLRWTSPAPTKVCGSLARARSARRRSSPNDGRLRSRDVRDEQSSARRRDPAWADAPTGSFPRECRQASKSRRKGDGSQRNQISGSIIYIMRIDPLARAVHRSRHLRRLGRAYPFLMSSLLRRRCSQ
jgi:hypothetical protein